MKFTIFFFTFFVSLLLEVFISLPINGNSYQVKDTNINKKHCLAPDTKITMSDDTMKDISEIKEGDSVLSFNTRTRTFEESFVIKVHSTLHNRLLRIRISNGSSIEVTSDHPFFTPSGWVSVNPMQTKQYARYKNENVEQLDATTELYYYDITQNKVLNVVSIDGFLQVTNTYTLELNGDGAFIANSFIVGQE